MVFAKFTELAYLPFLYYHQRVWVWIFDNIIVLAGIAVSFIIALFFYLLNKSDTKKERREVSREAERKRQQIRTELLNVLQRLLDSLLTNIRANIPAGQEISFEGYKELINSLKSFETNNYSARKIFEAAFKTMKRHEEEIKLLTSESQKVSPEFMSEWIELIRKLEALKEDLCREFYPTVGLATVQNLVIHLWQMKVPFDSYLTLL